MTESGEEHEKCHGELCVGFHGDGRVALMDFICDCPQEYSPLIMIMLAASGGFSDDYHARYYGNYCHLEIIMGYIPYMLC